MRCFKHTAECLVGSYLACFVFTILTHFFRCFIASSWEWPKNDMMCTIMNDLIHGCSWQLHTWVSNKLVTGLILYLVYCFIPWLQIFFGSLFLSHKLHTQKSNRILVFHNQKRLSFTCQAMSCFSTPVRYVKKREFSLYLWSVYISWKITHACHIPQTL